MNARHRHLPRLTGPSFRSRLAIVAGAVLACALLAGPFPAGAADKPSAQAPQREQLTISPVEAQPWTGDLDGMIERRTIRVLTTHSKTFYFLDKGVQRGATYDFLRLFEDDLNKKLAANKKKAQKLEAMEQLKG